MTDDKTKVTDVTELFALAYLRLCKSQHLDASTRVLLNMISERLNIDAKVRL